MKQSKQFSGGLSLLVSAAALVAFMTVADAEAVIEISTLKELQEIRKDEVSLSGNYLLTSDIDASGLDNFEPIGDSTDRFTGVFDGNGYIITGLTINRPDANFVGLFGYVGDDGVVRNVALEDCLVTGRIAVGTLAGRNSGTVLKSHVTGEIDGDERVGGLIGCNEGEVSGSHARVDVTGDQYVGGLVGKNCKMILVSHATGDVTAWGNIVGGLVGENYQGTVSQSYAMGDVAAGEGYAGGLVGRNRGGDGNIEDSYSTGEVTGGRRVGGLVGHTTQSSTVKRSYSTGKVTGDEEVGGLLGNRLGSAVVEASFWDIDTSGQPDSAGGDGVQGKSTNAMQDKSTFTDAGWNFDDIWAIDENISYPYLMAHQPLFGDVTGDGKVTATDLQVVINAVLGLDVEADYEPDVNGDGCVDALDVQLVILVLLGLLG